MNYAETDYHKKFVQYYGHYLPDCMVSLKAQKVSYI